MSETVISVGIDVGTSTTELVFSRLTIENVAGAFVVPRISIVDKTVIYRSRIYLTPLINPELIGKNRAVLESWNLIGKKSC